MNVAFEDQGKREKERGEKSDYLSQSFQALLLSVRVDIGTDDKTDDVEEGHPGVFGEELLRKRQGQRRGDPADLHDGHEAGAHGSANLVDGACAGDDTHGGEVDGVLDRGNLFLLTCLLIIRGG